MATVRVLYDFNAEDEAELSIREGQMLVLADASTPTPEGWLLVKTTSGESGFVPKDYIAIESSRKVSEPETPLAISTSLSSPRQNLDSSKFSLDSPKISIPYSPQFSSTLKSSLRDSGRMPSVAKSVRPPLVVANKLANVSTSGPSIAAAVDNDDHDELYRRYLPLMLCTAQDMMTFLIMFMKI
jgi:Variant SH3 domain